MSLPGSDCRSDAAYAPDPNCPKCTGTGWYSYDHNHGKPCEVCCTHPEGWWKLTEHHGASDEKYAACYRPGCGTTITKDEWDALPEGQQHVF